MKQRASDIDIIAEADTFINSGGTTHSVAKQLKMSKSTLYKHLVGYLPEIDHTTAETVRNLLTINQSEGRVKGGRNSHKEKREEVINENNQSTRDGCLQRTQCISKR